MRGALARLISPGPRSGRRMYATARPSRLSGGYPSDSSSDQELTTSLTPLRGRSRQLVRDASYAKRAKVLIVNNVIGSGIGMQSRVKSTRGELNKPVNDAIEAAWDVWSRGENCHTGGVLHFSDFERQLMGQVFEAGEVIVRKHYSKFGKSDVPYALEIIEAERIADEYSPGPLSPENMVRMGIEVDPFYRPVRYWLRERHKGEFRLGVSRSDRIEPVAASEIIHLKLTDRWPQTRGEPWMHTVIRRLQDMEGYSEAEIVAARAAASYFATIKSSDDPKTPVAGAEQQDGGFEMEIEPGMVKKLGPGEELDFHAPNRPNSALDPFMRYMLREVAAGVGPSYESLSKDYSQSNYSSSRLALLDDRDLWRYFQLWFIRSFREPVHRDWLQAAVLGRAVQNVGIEAYATDAPRYETVCFKPRGWSWIDPTKEVEAYVKAVRAGFTDVTDVIAKTGDGRDIEDVLDARETELKLMKDKGLQFDTDPERDVDGNPIGPTAEETTAVAKESAKAKAAQLGAVAKPADGAKPEPKEGDEERTIERIVRLMAQSMGDVLARAKPPQALINLAPEIRVEQPAVNVKGGDVHVAPPSITVNPGDVRIENHLQPTPVEFKPQVNVAAPNVEVKAPDVRVDVAAPQVHVAAPNVEIKPAEVRVENHIPAPNVNVAAPNVTVEPPVVNVAAPEVRIENHVEAAAAPNVTVEATTVNISPADVRVEAPNITVEAPKVDVQVAAPNVTVEVPQVQETVQEIEREGEAQPGDIRRIKTTTKR